LQVVLDTLVQRMGDAVAAAAFSALPGGFGPSAFAAAVVPVCLGWAALGLGLGQQQQVWPWRNVEIVHMLMNSGKGGFAVFCYFLNQSGASFGV